MNFNMKFNTDSDTIKSIFNLYWDHYTRCGYLTREFIPPFDDDEPEQNEEARERHTVMWRVLDNLEKPKKNTKAYLQQQLQNAQEENKKLKNLIDKQHIELHEIKNKLKEIIS